MLKNLPGRVFSMRREAGEMVFSAGGSEVRVEGMEAEEFPEVELPQGRLLAVPLRAVTVNEVAYAVGKDETRYRLTGVSVKASGGRLELAGCDGHRLSVVREALPPGSVVDVEDSGFQGHRAGAADARRGSPGAPARGVGGPGAVREVGRRAAGRWDHGVVRLA